MLDEKAADGQQAEVQTRAYGPICGQLTVVFAVLAFSLLCCCLLGSFERWLTVSLSSCCCWVGVVEILLLLYVPFISPTALSSDTKS